MAATEAERLLQLVRRDLRMVRRLLEPDVCGPSPQLPFKVAPSTTWGACWADKERLLDLVSGPRPTLA